MGEEGGDVLMQVKEVQVEGGAAHDDGRRAGSIATTSKIGLIDCVTCEGLVHSIMPPPVIHQVRHDTSQAQQSQSQSQSQSQQGFRKTSQPLGDVVCCEEATCYIPPLPLLPPNTLSSSLNLPRSCSSSSVEFECDLTDCHLLPELGSSATSTSALSSSVLLFDDCEECHQIPSPLINTYIPPPPPSPSSLQLECCSTAFNPSLYPPANLANYSCCSFDDCFGLASTSTTSSSSIITPNSECPECPPAIFDQQQHHQILQNNGQAILDATNINLLTELMKDLDEQVIQEILHCCRCAPGIERDPTNWDVTQHDSHKASYSEDQDSSTAFFDLAETCTSTDANLHHHLHLPQIPHGEDRNVSLSTTTYLQCEWRDCKARFESYALLVMHVNNLHLAPPNVYTTTTTTPRETNLTTEITSTSSNFSAPIAPPSSVSRPTATLKTLKNGQHLPSPYGAKRCKLNSFLSSDSSTTNGKESLNSHHHQHHQHHHHHHRHEHEHDHHHSGESSPQEEALETNSSSSRSSTSGLHPCRWTSCTQTFQTTSELMTHLSNFHVGSGKATYTCEWEGCNRKHRQDGQGQVFTQRQKVMRHLQTHTRDKPFVCDVCDKRFSEGLSLAQHKRLHTGEKPHECPYEDCNRAFTSASALTIHIRHHTGARPFMCNFEGCDAAFAESSNLAKHHRTHQLERSFECTVEGCGKCFLRVDQLKRHLKIHEKGKSLAVGGGGGGGGRGGGERGGSAGLGVKMMSDAEEV